MEGLLTLMIFLLHQLLDLVLHLRSQRGSQELGDFWRVIEEIDTALVQDILRLLVSTGK